MDFLDSQFEGAVDIVLCCAMQRHSFDFLCVLSSIGQSGRREWPAVGGAHHEVAMSTEVSSAPVAFVRDRATWLAYLLSFYYAYVINILGPLTPFLRSELSLTYTLASLHFSAFAAGMLVAGVSADRVTGRLGRRRTLWAGAFGMAGGVLVLLAARQAIVTITACFLMGAVGSWILAVYPAMLADRHGRLAAISFTEGTIAGGAGAAAAPILLGLLAYSSLGWRAALLLPILALIPLFLAYRTEPLAATAPAPRPLASSDRPTRSLPGAYWAYWSVLVTVISIEFCIILWIADFLRSERGLAPADAALAGALVLAAMLAGRIAGSRLLQRFSPQGLLFASLAVTMVGFLLFWQVHNMGLVAVGLVAAGLGVANLYPTTLALAVGVAPGQPDQASARASLASGTAIIALPFLLGRIADQVGIAPAFALVGVLTLAAAALLLLVTRLLARRPAV
jgi:fucose permease